MSLSDLLFLLSILSVFGLVYLLTKPALERVVPKLKEELNKARRAIRSMRLDRRLFE